jgi:SpoVK/Ycf46/Vps4 family AAA+-type ATPase
MAGRKSNPTDAKTYYQLGNEYYEKGDYDKAIENYNMAILLNPVFSEAYFNRALSYYQLKNFDKSISDYTKSMELDPQNPIIFNNRGDAFYRKQDFQSAIKDYDKAISLNPNYLKAFYNRGLSYASIEEYEKAVEDFSKVLKLKPDFAEAYHLRGLAYEYAGSLSNATKDYEKALELNPELTEAKTHLESAKAKKDQEGKGGGKEGGTADIQMLSKPDMTFEDVAGMDKMKEEIREAVVYPMSNPELARKYGKLGGGGILMYGPPGCGKCVRGNTPVFLADGGQSDIHTLYEKAKARGEEKDNGHESIIENPGFEVPSLDIINEKTERKSVTHAYKQRYKGKIHEIITRSGRRVEVTPEHPFITKSNSISKTKAAELTLGSFIAAPEDPSNLDSEVIWEEVSEINTSEIDEYVYDLTVADNHTFVAGSGGLFVHNTFIVKAAAGECHAGFINAKLSDLLDMYVGNTEKNIHKVFELARKNTPCILFFDEVDAIGGRRDQGEGAQYMKMAVNQMLYEMDGVEANNQNVLIIAATNAPWDVDPALRRSGRFSKTIYVPEPDYGSRVAILKMHAKKRPLSKFIPFRLLGLAMMGYASADHKAVVDAAATIPWKEAFMGIEKRIGVLVKGGMSKEEAESIAKKQVKQRSLSMGDFVKSISKKRSSLPPWYEQAKKQIGKQEEVTIIDGKEHKKVTDSKMGAGEKEAFKDLLGTINNRNAWHSKIILTVVKTITLTLLRIFVFVSERGRVV